MKLSFAFLKASLRVPLGLKYLEKVLSEFCTRKRGVILLLQDAAFKIGHTQENID